MLKIKYLRNNKNESQSYLAEIINVSLRTIQNYESGKVDVPTKKLELIAQHYDVSISELFNENEVIKKEVSKKLIYKGIEIPNDLIINFVSDNWSELMKDRLFLATFKGEAFEYYMKLKENNK
jgi:transcriptional regulator with XRE-family HTH domain